MRATGCVLIFALPVFALPIFACAALFHAQEAEEGDSRRIILAQEQAWSEAEARGDTRALDRIFDNALVYVEGGRVVGKGECLSRMRSAGSRLRQIQPGSTTVQIYGNTAIVVGTYRDKAVIGGKIALRRWRFIDTWVNKNEEWLLVATGAAPVNG